MSNALPQLFQLALDSNGEPISGSKLNFYAKGTTTRLDTYSDEPLTTAHANPVVADSAGRFAAIWLAASDYKVVWTDADDVTITTFPTVHGTIDVTGDAYAPSQQSTPDMTVLLAAGTLFNTVSKAIVTNAAQTSAVITAPSSNPRKDIIYVDRLTGAVGVETGSEGASPSDPTIADNKLPVARVTLATTTTEITDSLIDDIRHLGLLGSGGYAVKDPAVLAKAVAYPVVIADDGKLIDVDASGGARTITLPTVATAGDGFIIGVKKTDSSANAVTVDGNGSETIDGATTRTIGFQYAAEFYRCDGTEWHLESNTSGITLGTEQATTSGSSFTFAIPVGARRITVMFEGVSVDDTDDLLIQIGDAGGIETSGYVSSGDQLATVASSTAGFIMVSNNAADITSGHMVLTLKDAANFTWVSSHSVKMSTTQVGGGAGEKSLSEELTQLTLVDTGGDDFDAGSVNVSWEF